ncbi:Zinc finger protein ZAT5 [Linum grandiflorum]
MEMESKTQLGDPANFAVKRRRSASPPRSAASTTTTVAAAAAATSSSYGSTEEEDDQDMANCLILLAQGHHGGGGGDNRRKRVVAGEDSAGLFVYDCKTCNRSFPSFQALGGHRASHKKPKPNPGPTESEGKEVISPPSPVSPSPIVKQVAQSNTLQQQLAVKLGPVAVKPGPGAKSGKVHECAICGAEFTSGQALGGHMRRHRASNGSSPTTTEIDQKKRNNVLTLDLNLPAPEDRDNREGDQSKFRFASSMVFSSPALVDCHY